MALSVIRRALPALPAGISRTWLRRILLANLVGQVLIVLSGGIVRLTGSGLGCPTFPECVPGSYIPVVTQPQGVHKFIEFGNRMLTFVLTLLAVAALLAVLRHVRAGGAGRRLLWLGALPFIGVMAQALIGGISVLTELNPTVVAIHFLVSMSLIAGSTVLLLVAVPPQRQPAAPWEAPRSVRVLAIGLAIVTVPVLALGTTVTGSGPHSGDANDPNRFGFNVATVAHLHADAVWLFVVVLIALIVTLLRSDAPALVRRRGTVLLALTLTQGVIGYLQYALGVPIALVGVHMLGASLLVVATTALAYEVLSRTSSQDFVHDHAGRAVNAGKADDGGLVGGEELSGRVS